jgi:hypothetical protein
MKKQHISSSNRMLSILSAILFFAFQAKAADPFQIVWAMDGTLVGAASNSNFIPEDAELTGAHPFSLWPYLPDGTGGQAHVSTYWSTNLLTERYLDFSFGVSTYEYNLSSITFRIRRSGTGPADVAVRTSMDGFSSNLSSFHLSADGLFYNVTVPLGFKNLSSGIAFRIYAYNADYRGTLYVDQVVLSGEVTSFVLPVKLTYYRAGKLDKSVLLNWETGWERNSKEFIIERSSNLIDFLPLGTVPASGETKERTQYEFIDELPLPGPNYYRLRMVDHDQSYVFSVIRDVFFRSDTDGLIVSPNPASANLIRILILKNKTDHSILSLVSVTGQNIPFEKADSGGAYMDLYPLKSFLLVR